MGYRKFKADYIFDGYQILPNTPVLITNDKGKIIEIIDQQFAGDGVETLSGLLCPGFINTHCHIELSHLKEKIEPKLGLVDFVQQVMTQRATTQPEIFKAMLLAHEEMYKSGIVAIGDICNTTDSISIKQGSKIRWHNFIELSGFDENFAQTRFAAIEEIKNQFSNLTAPFSITPHAPYSVSKKLFQLINNITKKQIISIHNQESQEENKLYQNKTGNFLNLYNNFNINITDFVPTHTNSFKTWLSYFTNNQSIISVHNSFTTQQDLEIITNSNTLHFCICPNANKYIENTMPPINLLRKNNCKIVMGTDSYASNWQLNMLAEIKTIQQETNNEIPLQEILQWATINGARALQLDTEVGSFEKDKTPGVVLISNIENKIISNKTVSKRIL